MVLRDLVDWFLFPRPTPSVSQLESAFRLMGIINGVTAAAEAAADDATRLDRAAEAALGAGWTVEPKIGTSRSRLSVSWC